jgi:3-isopropylmalate/(R)-2-methylmalate dehydratase large subunit
MNNKTPKTLFQKIWDNHIVAHEPESPAVLFIDLHLIHEVTSPQAFSSLRERGLKVRRPDLTIATMDHSTPTATLDIDDVDELAARQLKQLGKNCKDFNIPLYDLRNPQRGIVHVLGPELGLTQPGKTIVCGDSHTSTHGAFGALAFGIGTSEVEHVLATQCLLQNKPKSYQVDFTDQLAKGVTAKDMILALISEIGVGGGTGYVIEYTGPVIQALNMDERMTLCNMTIEAGARAGMIAPDETTFEFLKDRVYTPKGSEWDNVLDFWRTLPSDPHAKYDKTLNLNVSKFQPMITYGTNPGMGIPINGIIPDPAQEKDSNKREGQLKALQYMQLTPGQALLGHPISTVFIGSCTNGRISDLRQAASLLKGKKVNKDTRLLVVPGSESIKRQAEEEGLDRIFKEAGADWRYSGCSMCIAMNGDQLEPGEYCVSTSNRNFEGRQGAAGRTFLASPLTAAISALNGHISDPRPYL